MGRSGMIGGEIVYERAKDARLKKLLEKPKPEAEKDQHEEDRSDE